MTAPQYFLAAWKRPRVRTNAAARSVLYAQDQDTGSPQEFTQFAAGISAATQGQASVTRVLGAAVIELPESLLYQYARSLSEIATNDGYVLFDPQCDRLVVPRPPNAREWPPAWTKPVTAVREAAAAVGSGDPRGLANALRTEVLRRTGGRRLPPPAKVDLPFEPPAGIALPYLVPETQRTAKGRANLVRKLKGARPETRVGAAFLLAGWVGDDGAMNALSDGLANDRTAMVRGLSAFGLSISAALDRVTATALVDELRNEAEKAGAWEPLVYALLAAFVVAYQTSDPTLTARIQGVLASGEPPPLYSPEWRALQGMIRPADALGGP